MARTDRIIGRFAKSHAHRSVTSRTIRIANIDRILVTLIKESGSIEIGNRLSGYCRNCSVGLTPTHPDSRK